MKKAAFSSRRYYVIPLLRYILAALALALLLPSCEYKELCLDHSHWAQVNIAFDWSNAPKAEPKSMTVLFYDLDHPEAEPVRYDYAGSTGGSARLNAGTYRIVGYNRDTETILFRHYTSVDALEAYTRWSSIEEGTQIPRYDMPRAEGAEYEPIILEPDPFYAAATEDTIVLQPNERNRTIVIKPDYRFINLNIRINNVPNLQYSGQFGGTLSGLASARTVVSGALNNMPATQAFPISVVGDSTLQMQTRIFGHCPELDKGVFNSHLLTIYAILADNSQWYTVMDITEQFHNAKVDEASETIEITIDDGIPLPKPIVNGSGFQPTVDGWQSIEIDVGM